VVTGRGVFQMRTCALIGAKNFGIFEIYGVSARTREEGVEAVRTRGVGGVNFSRFCADVFYEQDYNYKTKTITTKWLRYCFSFFNTTLLT